jgi:hypothetical protein
VEVPRIPLNFNPQSERSFDQYMNQEPVSDSADQYKAAAELALSDTATMLGARMYGVKELEGSGVGKISPEEANQRFPDMPTPFRENVNPYVAQLQYDQQQRKMELSRKIENGPQDAWSKTKVVGAGLIAHALDPVEFGAGAVLGWGVGGLAARGAFGARIAGTAAKVAAGEASTIGRLGFNAAEAGAGNLIQNIGQEGLQSATISAEGGTDSRTNGEVLTDIAYNTFAATALGLAIKEAPYQLRGLKRMLRNTSPEADLAVARAIVGNLENDIRPDIEPMLKTLAQETSVNPKNFGKNPYNFVRGIEGTFYAATKDASFDLSTGQKVPLGDDFGMGVHLSDNPGVANAAAARSMADSVGAVHQVEIGKLNPLDVDAIVKPEIHEVLQAPMKALGEDVRSLENMTTKDALEMIRNGVDEGLLPEDTMDGISKGLQERGYNALQSDGKSHMGFEHDAHNHITVLDESLIKSKGAFEPEPGMVNGPDSQAVADVAARQEDFRSHMLVDSQKYDETLAEIQDIPPEAVAPSAEAKAQIDSLVEELTAVNDQGHMTPGEKAEFERIQEAVKDLEVKNTLVKAAATCIGA